MFKSAIYTDRNDRILDVSDCAFMRETSNNDIIVVSSEMLYSIDVNKFSPSLLVIIGSDHPEQYKGPLKSFQTIKDSIKYLSEHHAHELWWVVGSAAMVNSLIWNGAIADVYIIKSDTLSVPDRCVYDGTMLDEPSCGFAMEQEKKDDCMVSRYSRRNHEEIRLLEAMGDIIQRGSYRQNRTGVATYSTFGKQFEYHMVERIDPLTGERAYRFPLLTTKKMFLRGVFAELKWFLGGQTDSKTLEEQGVNIWKGNSTREYLDSYGLSKYEDGKCGPIYGHQWRSWNAPYDQTRDNHIGDGYDQVMTCVDSLKYDPFSRRHIISGWNVSQLEDMALPPCHVLYQFYVHEEDGEKYLSLSMYQRSGDTFLGIPFNVCSMGLFLLIMAHHVGYKPYKLVHTVGDMHVYETHLDAVARQLVRAPNMFPFARMTGAVRDCIEDYEFSDVVIDGYVSHGPIKAGMVA